MIVSYKVCFALLMMAGTLGPAAPAPSEPSAPVEQHRQVPGGEQKSRIPGGTLGDAGIVEGSSGTHRAPFADSPAKGGVPGGTLHGAVSPGGDTQVLVTGEGEDAKSRVSGGTLPDGLATGKASALRAGASAGSRKSGVSGGTLSGGTLSGSTVRAGDAAAARRSSAEGAPKSRVRGGSLSVIAPEPSAASASIRSTVSDVQPPKR